MAELSRILTMASGQVVPFDSVHTNIAGLYQATGTFTCAVSGTYLFVTEVMKHWTKADNFQAEIQLNNQTKSRMLTKYYDGHSNTADAMSILHCNQNDVVHVAITDTHNDNTVRTNDKNTFVGFLLHQDPLPPQSVSTQYTLSLCYMCMYTTGYKEVKIANCPIIWHLKNCT